MFNSESINSEVVDGDIKQQNVDAIVNVANHTLPGGGGVDGSIHRATSLGLRVYRRNLGSCDTGQAVISPGFIKMPNHNVDCVVKLVNSQDLVRKLIPSWPSWVQLNYVKYNYGHYPNRNRFKK